MLCQTHPIHVTCTKQCWVSRFYERLGPERLGAQKVDFLGTYFFMLSSSCQAPFRVLPFCCPGLILPSLPRNWCASILAFALSEACGLERRLRKPILNLPSSCFKPKVGRKQIGGMMQTLSLCFATFGVQKTYNLGAYGPSFPLSCNGSSMILQCI